MIHYGVNQTRGPGYDEYPVGTKAQLTQDHMYRGGPPSVLEVFKGDTVEVVAPTSARDLASPHIVGMVTVGGQVKRKWFDLRCLGPVTGGSTEPTSDEIAALFGLKTDVEVLTNVISATDVGRHLSDEARTSLAEAITASPVWRKA